VRDEISSRVAFETRWRELVDEMLDEPALEQPILLMLAAGVRLDHLRAVAEVLDDNWDLLDRIGEPAPLAALDVSSWLTELDEVCALVGDCRDDDDKLLLRMSELEAYGARLRGAFDDIERVQLLKAPKPSFAVTRTGNKKNWTDITTVRERVARLGERRDQIVNDVLEGAIRHVVAALGRGTTRTVAERRVAGELEFHDLLVMARALLRDPASGAHARTRLRDRYRVLLVDEFQDTDPIQADLAALLATPPTERDERPWFDMPVDRGRLFFVGDPKQSIYRFRRADIGTFLMAADHYADPAPVLLTCNFRTTPDVLAWVNAVFSELIQATPGSQPAYRRLDAVRAAAPAASDVVLLGVDAHADIQNADDLRTREATDVAQAVLRAITDEWPVADAATGDWRPARLGDICVLLPARTSLPFLERALDDAGIAYRAETSSLVYGSREVRELLAALRAVDDPSDSLSLVTALRSSLFGCGDDDLFEYKVEYGGAWDVRFDPPEQLPLGHPVGDAIRYLRSLHEARLWSAPSELLERLVRERNVVEVAALGGRFRDVARRVRFLVDQARAFADAESGTLRDYLEWAQLQGTEGARVVEAVLPETDDDAVRILTVHGAKGLEFPIVICSGATTAAQTRSRGVQVLFPASGGYEVRMTANVQTQHFELHQPVDEQMGFHEKLRLLYVACTRARDHLVVSVHRKERSLPDEASKWTHAELLWNAARHARWARFDAQAPVVNVAVSPVTIPEPMTPEAWEAEHARAFERGARRGFVGATTLAARVDEAARVDPGLAKDGRDLELPPWNKGRYGTAIGRAVHAVLQTIDLATGAGLEETAAAQAAAEGVLGHEKTIVSLVQSALDSDVVRRAAARPFWRETYVAVPLDGITLEGYIDLAFRDDDGLVVVDYKTDAVRGDELEARLGHYRVQAAAYALAVAEATGAPVVRCVLCLLDPAGAHEEIIEGSELAAGVETVRRLAAAERATPSPLPAPTLVDA
jgi:ATP-dependent exoDNAse (exonuclease V) beta subunit